MLPGAGNPSDLTLHFDAQASVRRQELEEARKQLAWEREWIQVQKRERDRLETQLSVAQEVACSFACCQLHCVVTACSLSSTSTRMYET